MTRNIKKAWITKISDRAPLYSLTLEGYVGTEGRADTLHALVRKFPLQPAHPNQKRITVPITTFTVEDLEYLRDFLDHQLELINGD